jgi:DnaK suppressor protein
MVRALQTAELQQGIGSGREEGDFAITNHVEHLSGKRITYQSCIIREIDSAIKRIDEGTFGCCEECGDDILHARLLAVPFAKLCVDCQEIRERSLVCA